MIRRRTVTCAMLAVVMLVRSTPAAADSRPVDAERSTLTIYAYKSGLFSAFADNHVIRAPIASGRVSEEGTLAVELAVDAVQMTVLDPALPADKRAEVQARMRGPEVLDSTRYPDIRFASTDIAPDGVGQWRVSGDLTLHGVSRPLTFTVTRRDGHYRGAVMIRQRDFGIQPISIVGGTVKVKDDLRVEFDIVAKAL
jgi:polyisoprenoid-binding protein YceI